MSDYHYLDGDNQQQGPFAKGEMLLMLKDGTITGETMVFRDGDTEWRALSHWSELVIRPALPKASNATSSRSQNPEPVGKPGENMPIIWDDILQWWARYSPTERRNWIGKVLLILGMAITLFFLLFYDTGVETESGYSSIERSRTKVHNLGRLQNRLLGCSTGFVLIIIGTFTVIMNPKK